MPNITNFPTGRVGIGTENPQQTLDVAGTLRVTGSTGTPSTLMGRNASGDVATVTVGSGLGINESNQLYATGGASGTTTGSGSTNQVAYWTGTNVLSGENNLWWDFSADRLGIGTNAPARSLDVIGGIRFSTVNGTPTTVVGVDASGDIGSVSIGTGLGLSGGVLSFTGSTGGSGTVTGTGTTNYLSKWASASGLTDSIVLETGNTIDINGSLRVRTSSGTATNVMGRDANGYVSNLSIGSGLSVSGGTLLTTGVTFGTGADGRVAYWTGTNQIGNDNNFLWDAENDRLGIGAFPTSALHISSANSASIRIVKTGASPADFSLVALNGKLDIGSAFTITDTGRLGLGTNAPAQTLDVAGNMRLTGSTGTSATVMGRSVDGDISAISVGSGLSLSGNVLTTTGGTSGTVTGTGTVNYLSKWASSTGLTNSIALETGNTIDIAGALRVTTASGTATLIAGQDTNGYFSRITVGSGLSLVGNTLTATGGGGNVSGSGTATQVAFWNGTTSLTGNTNLYWDNSNNRLGIGTSSPSNQLTTTGDASISTLTVGRGNFSLATNTAVGVNALVANVTSLSSGNTAIGYFSLSGNAGVSNTAIGYLSAIKTTGNFNVAVGSDTLTENIGGASNTAVGRAALSNNTSGSSIVAIGANALSNNITGNSSVAVGASAGTLSAAGTNLTTATSSIFIGANSRASNISPSNQIVIGTSAIGLADNATVIGTTGTTQTHLYGNLTLGLTSADTTARVKATSSDGSSSSFAAKFQNNSGTDILSVRGDGVVGIGTNSPAQTLDIRGTMRLTGSTGDSTTVMGRNANGDVSAISIGSGLSLSGNTLTTTGTTGVSGSGTATQVAFWGGSTTLSGSSDMVYDGSYFTMGNGKGISIGVSGTNRRAIMVGAQIADNLPQITVYPASGINAGAVMSVSPKGTGFNTTLKSQFTILNTDVVADPNNIEFMSHRAAGANFTIGIGASGAGSLRPLLISCGAISSPIINTNQFWVNTNGTISINKTSTDYQLDVTAASNNNGFRVVGSGNTSGNAFLVQNSTPTNLIQVVNNGDISFGTALNWNATNTRLGIGTASPTARLHVLGTGTTTGTTFLTQSSGGTETFRILDNGNVGVNIASPAARLYVKGSTSGNGSTAFEVTDNTDRDIINVRDDGRITLGRNLASTVQSSVTIEAVGSETDINVAIVPKGNGAITAAIPNNSSTGGNARGQYAVDLQLERVLASHVASANYSTINGGSLNTASGQYSSIIGGFFNTASAQFSSILGGNQGLAYLYGQNSTASGAFSTAGDTQTSNIRLWREITGSGQTELFLNGLNAAALLTATNKVWLANIFVVATVRSIGAGVPYEGAVGDTFAEAYIATIKKIGNTTSLVGSVHTENTMSDALMTTSIVSIDANDSNDSLRIRFTPPSNLGNSSVTRVVATVYLTEVGF